MKVSGYFDFNHLFPVDPGRSVLAARALAGVAQGASEFSLPPDQRFYGGGSGTIRGYRYQSVGPQFADGQRTDRRYPRSRQAAWNYGSASARISARHFFVDAGQVSGRPEGRA